MQSVRVTLGKAYDVIIGDGLLDCCGQEIASLFRPARLALVMDDTVNQRYGRRAIKSLTAAGFDVRRHVLPSGERAKNGAALIGVLEFLGENHMLKTDQLVWMGGGSVGDVCGLAAALYQEGMYVVQIPTTLVAAACTATGSHMSVNLKSGRDLASISAEPSLALCDSEIMRELPPALVREGAAEMVRYALLGSESLFEKIEAGELLTDINHAIERCIALRADLARMDEYDAATHQLMNMGNTVARALSTCSEGKLSYGQCLAIALATLARAVPTMVPGEKGCAARIERALTACDLPTACEYGRGELLTAIASTLRRGAAYMSIAVPLDVCKVELRRVTLDGLGAWLEAGGVTE